MAKDRDRQLVYSSDGGRTCPRCGAPRDACACREGGGQVAPRGDGVVRVGRETKGRKGAGVTVVSGAPLDEAGLRELAAALKKACGSGGTLKDGVIEVQGEHRDRIVALLQARGWVVRRVGG